MRVFLEGSLPGFAAHFLAQQGSPGPYSHLCLCSKCSARALGLQKGGSLQRNAEVAGSESHSFIFAV